MSRLEAIRRIIWAILFSFIVAPIFTTIWGIVAAVMMVIDILWQLVTGGEGPLDGKGALMDAWEWFSMNIKWITTGGGDPDYFPYV